jgi:low temperature requirement protein LtrA
MTSEISGRFKRWFWRPPRAHGEVIADRQVSNLELFYDLVYVAVLGQAAHHLVDHVSIRGLAEFAVVFALIWIAWINGTLYLFTSIGPRTTEAAEAAAGGEGCRRNPRF